MKLEEMVGKRMTEAQFDEAAGEKDACYRKVKARYDVWPSAYASGALVKCRKVGAANWGNKSKKEGLGDRMSKKLKKNKGVNLKKKIKDISKHEESFDTKFTKKKDVNEKKGDFLDSLFPKAKVDKAVKIAKSMGGNMSGAVKKIEKMFKGMSKHTKVKDALRLANESVNENKCLCEACWKGYEKKGMKKMFGKMYPNCVKKEGIQTTTWIGEGEVYWENNIGESGGYTFEYDNNDLNEAEYQGRKVKLGKIMQGDAKKFKVYVKNPKGNTVKVNFGQGGDAKGGTMKIRKSNPGARKSFRARHNCDNPGPRHKARYWSCRKW